MEFFAEIALQILGEYLVYRCTKNKVLWLSLFLKTLINLQMIFLLTTLLFFIYERWAGITEYTATQFMVVFFKFHCITVQPWATLVLAVCSLGFALTCLYHSRENRKHTLAALLKTRKTKHKTSPTP